MPIALDVVLCNNEKILPVVREQYTRGKKAQERDVDKEDADIMSETAAFAAHLQRRPSLLWPTAQEDAMPRVLAWSSSGDYFSKEEATISENSEQSRFPMVELGCFDDRLESGVLWMRESSRMLKDSANEGIRTISERERGAEAATVTYTENEATLSAFECRYSVPRNSAFCVVRRSRSRLP